MPIRTRNIRHTPVKNDLTAGDKILYIDAETGKLCQAAYEGFRGLPGVSISHMEILHITAGMMTIRIHTTDGGYTDFSLAEPKGNGVREVRVSEEGKKTVLLVEMDSGEISRVELPHGKDGQNATINIGSVSVGTPSVTNVGTPTNAVLNFVLPEGEQGQAGKSVQLRTTDTHIEWRQEGGNWQSLVALADIQGPQGNTGNTGLPGHDGEDGTDGVGIQNISSSRSGKTVTVTVSLTNGQSHQFSLQDGADGNGAGDMLKSENLAGLDNPALARENIQVYSKAEVDAQFSGKLIEVNVSTAYNAQHKVGTTAAGNYVPKKGDTFLINFVNGTQVNQPTLNIDGSGAKHIRAGYYNVGTNMLNLNRTENSNIKVMFWYDGQYYQIFGAGHNNTYGEIPEAEITNASLSSARLVSGRRLAKIKEYFEQNVPTPTQATHAVNRQYVDQKVASIPAPDLSALATKQELQQGLGGKANSTHTHTIEQVTGLGTQLVRRELAENKKTTINGNETSDEFYPTTKAVFDWVVGKLAGLAKLNESNTFVGNQVFHQYVDGQAGVEIGTIDGYGGIKLKSDTNDTLYTAEFIMNDEDSAGVILKFDGEERIHFTNDGIYQKVGNVGGRCIMNSGWFDAIVVIKRITQQEYDALPVKDPNTLYIVI